MKLTFKMTKRFGRRIKLLAWSLVIIATIGIGGYAASTFHQQRVESKYVGGLYVGFRNISSVPGYAFFFLENYLVAEEDVSCYQYKELAAYNASCGVEFKLPKRSGSSDLMPLTVTSDYDFWGLRLEGLTIDEQCTTDYYIVLLWDDGLMVPLPVCTTPTTWNATATGPITAVMLVNGA